MTISRERTIKVPLRTQTYGVLLAAPDLRWVSADREANLDWTLDVSLPLADVGDLIASVSWSIAPSGTGQRVILDLMVTGSLITGQLTGGVCGQNYENKLVVTGLSDREWTWRVGQLIGPNAARYPLPEPPSRGFGTPVTWTSGAAMFGPSFMAVATGLVATGTDQATALPLPAQTNIVVSAPAGAGAVLSAEITSGTIVVQNDDPANALPIYPPEGAQINSLAVNAPFLVGSAGARISFTTLDATSQWSAG